MTLEEQKIKYIALLFLLTAKLAIADDYTHTQNNNDHFMVRFTSMDDITVQIAQQRVYPYAIRLCKSKNMQYGKYKYEKNEAITKNAPEPDSAFILNQEILCKDPKITKNTSEISTASIDEKKTKNIINDLTISYFTLQEQGKF